MSATDELTRPTVRRCLSTGKMSHLTGGLAFPTGKLSLPTDEKCHPTGEMCCPTDEKLRPTGEKGLPTGNLPAVIGGMAFFYGDKRPATGRADLVVSDQFSLDGRAVFGRLDNSGF